MLCKIAQQQYNERVLRLRLFFQIRYIFIFEAVMKRFHLLRKKKKTYSCGLNVCFFNPVIEQVFNVLCLFLLRK